MASSPAIQYMKLPCKVLHHGRRRQQRRLTAWLVNVLVVVLPVLLRLLPVASADSESVLVTNVNT